MQHAAGALLALLSVQVAMSMMFLVFATTYIRITLLVLLPQQYLTTSAPEILVVWVWYIPVLALNGSLEAFLSSVATPNELHRQSRYVIIILIEPPP